MPRFLFAAALLPVLCQAAILPETIGSYQRTATHSVPVADRPVWDEYGLKEAEAATYENGADKLNVTAWQLSDSTASMAAFEWQRKADSTPSAQSPVAAGAADSLLVAYCNYLLSFTGGKPDTATLTALTESLKNPDHTALPLLPGYLPVQGLVANSQRYITGPAALEKFFPGVPPAVAAFRYGAEAATGIYRTAKGNATVAVFNYPTHPIAREREAEFDKLPGAMVKRSGPLVAVVLNPPDRNAAENLLDQIRYQATVTRDEYAPTRRDNIGNLVVNAFVLIGILLAFAVLSGLAVGGLRAFRRHGKGGEEPDAILSLHLDRFGGNP